MKRIKNWEDSPSYEKRRLKIVGMLLAAAAVFGLLLIVLLKATGFFLALVGGAGAAFVAFIVYMNTHPRDYPDMVFDGRTLQIPVPGIALDVTQPFQASFVVPTTITQYVYEQRDGSRIQGGQQLPWAILRVVQGGRVFSFYQQHGCDPGEVRGGPNTAHATPVLEGTVVYCNVGPLREVFFTGDRPYVGPAPIAGGHRAPLAMAPAASLGAPMASSPTGSSTSTPLGPAGPAAPAGFFTDGSVQSARLVVAPDYDFAKLQQSLRGLQLEPAGVGSEVVPGEPTSAQWQSSSSRVAYHFDPRTSLRRVEITGQNPTYLRNDLLNSAYLPSVEAYTLGQALQSNDPRQLLHAVGAAEFIGPEGEPQHLLPNLEMVAVLHAKTSPVIAAAALAATQTLKASFRRQGKL